MTSTSSTNQIPGFESNNKTDTTKLNESVETSLHDTTKEDQQPNPFASIDEIHYKKNRTKRQRLELDSIIQSAEILLESTEVQVFKTILQQLTQMMKEMAQDFKQSKDAQAELAFEVRQLRSTQDKLTLEVRQLKSTLIRQQPSNSTMTTFPYSPKNVNLPLPSNQAQQTGFQPILPNPLNVPLRPQTTSLTQTTSTNFRAATATTTYSSVAARNLVGNRADTIQIIPTQSHTMENTQQLNQTSKAPKEVLTRLTTTIREPEMHKITALRFPNMAPRKRVNAREWRDILRQESITTFAILFPRYNTLEILIPAEQEKQTTQFFQTLNREPEDPNPYKRRDGKKDALTQETLFRQVQGRIQMLKYERSVIALRYLNKTILDGTKMLEPAERQQLETELNHLMQDKRFHMKDSENTSQHSTVQPTSLLQQ